MTHETYRYCRYQVDGPLLTLTIDRPEVLNALDPDAHCEFADAFDRYAADASLRVAIVTGAGERAFCVGIGGALCDRIGRRPAMLVGSRTMLLAFIAFFPLILSGNTFLIAAAIGFLLCAAQFHAGVQPAYFAEAFPTEIRYRGSAVAYNLAVVVGSSTPFAATLIQAHTGGATWPIVAFGIAFNLLSMWAIHVGPEIWQKTPLTR
jgi:MFS family permease